MGLKKRRALSGTSAINYCRPISSTTRFPSFIKSKMNNLWSGLDTWERMEDANCMIYCTTDCASPASACQHEISAVTTALQLAIPYGSPQTSLSWQGVPLELVSSKAFPGIDKVAHGDSGDLSSEPAICVSPLVMLSTISTMQVPAPPALSVRRSLSSSLFLSFSPLRFNLRGIILLHSAPGQVYSRLSDITSWLVKIYHHECSAPGFRSRPAHPLGNQQQSTFISRRKTGFSMPIPLHPGCRTKIWIDRWWADPPRKHWDWREKCSSGRC